MNEHRPSPPVTYDTVVERLEAIAGHLDDEAKRHQAAAATLGVHVNAENAPG